MPAGLWSLDAAFRPYAQAFVDVLTDAGIPIQITSTRRSLQTQQKLYQDFLAGRSPYPAAPPGHSTHQMGYALDIDVPSDRSILPLMGELWESFGPGFRWGGRFKDPVHFDYKP